MFLFIFLFVFFSSVNRTRMIVFSSILELCCVVFIHYSFHTVVPVYVVKHYRCINKS